MQTVFLIVYCTHRLSTSIANNDVFAANMLFEVMAVIMELATTVTGIVCKSLMLYSDVTN